MKRIRLAQRRKTVGLSQEKLAELLRVDTSTVRRWEAGTAEPQPWLRPRLAKALRSSLADLAGLLGHDAGTGSRWPGGSPGPNVLSAILSDALGVPLSVTPMWPDLGQDSSLASAHLQPLVVGRTLEELGIFVRSDMLTRRETLTEVVKAISGPALLAPIARWLDESPARLAPNDTGAQRIGASDVETIERSTRYLATMDAEIGGALSREAAVGQLKYAVDLARHASYAESTGNRLLAVIAELAGLVGYMCHDSGMSGPAQRYFTFGLQAARESADSRAPFLVASILADVAEHIRYLDRPDTALQLHDLAINQLPAGGHQFNALRALLVARRAGNGLIYLGTSRLPEVQSAMSRAFDLYRQAADDESDLLDRPLWHRAIDVSEAELAVPAAVAYLVMARTDRRLIGEAEKYTLLQLAKVPESQARSKLFAQIRLATIRFLAGEVQQACDDGDQALHMTDRIASARTRIRLRELLADSEPYAKAPRVAAFRDRLRTAIAQLN